MNSLSIFCRTSFSLAIVVLFLQGCGSSAGNNNLPGIAETIAGSSQNDLESNSNVESGGEAITLSALEEFDTYFPTATDDSNTESICGASVDWTPVESYSGDRWPSSSYVSINESPVGRLKFYAPQGSGSCSGTMIAPDLFLTAGHCVEPEHTFLQVEMNYQDTNSGAPRDIEWFNVTEVVEDEIAGLDYAILRVQGDPGLRFGMTTPVARSVDTGTQLAIIQHPAGIRKVIDAGTALSSAGDRLYYGNIDTYGGSSGSGILDDQGNLVAVHAFGGCNSRGANSGTLIKDIANVSPVLTDLTRRVCPLQPIARYWNPAIKDHFYSAVFEPNGFWGYHFERYEYSVCKHPITGTIPYRQWWGNSDHFYTVDHDQYTQAILTTLGYEYEQVQGNVHTSPMNGTVPLRRYHNPTLKDHFYTIDDMPDGTFNYRFQKIEAYVFKQ